MFLGFYKIDNEANIMLSDWMVDAPNYAGGHGTVNNYPGAFIMFYAYCFGNGEKCAPLLEKLNKNCINTEKDPNICKVLPELYDNYYDFSIV